MGSPVRFFDIAGPAGRLEAVWKEPEGAKRGSAVLAHAHPLHGGTMHFKVLHRMAKAIARAGYGVLRFNFRGVGASEGVHDGGRGELEDFRAALDDAERRGGLPLLAGGFSFGATVALPVGAEDPRVESLIGAGVPLVNWHFGGMRAVAKPTLLVSGERDQFLPSAARGPSELEEAARKVFWRLSVNFVAGADHFFTDRLDELAAAVFDFAGGVGAEAVR
jgi:alpha/beta superfamily hydrolase